MTDLLLSAVSFRDPGGFVYQDHGCLFRQVNLLAREHYDLLLSSGLYRELIENGLLIRHEEVDVPPPRPSRAYKVIRPDRVAMISYPYEWSFSQFQDAALLTLAIERKALEFGMSLKDCSAYNVQFHNGRPILIDTLSLERFQEGTPWVAYRQFCQHFLAPLALLSLVDVRLGQLARANLDGVPLDLASRLLPVRSRLRFGLLLHVHLHGLLNRPGRAAEVTEGNHEGRFGRNAMLGLIDSLESTVRSLRYRPGRSNWVSYYDDNSYTPDQLAEKSRVVAAFLDRVRPSSVWDLGANTGRFSRLASGRGIQTVAFDLDPDCVEASYREVKDRGETHLLPLLLDLRNPSPASGWVNRERASILERAHPDMVLALALVHHLAIAGNLPLENLAQFFAGLAPWLAIEFIAPGDPQVQTLMTQRRGVHHPYHQAHFESCFGHYFQIQESRPIVPEQRTLYLLERRDGAPSTAG